MTPAAVPEPVTPTAPALRGPVLMNQDWRELTMVHWAVDPGRLSAFMPPGVRPDVLEGRTYVGLVLFRMVDAAPGHGRGVPWLGTFLETNVRVYSVDETGRRGVVFLSLDCDRLAVGAGARATFGLPYRWARMQHSRAADGGGDRHRYTSRLRRRGVPVDSRVEVRVRERVEPGPLDHFL
ncbi:MAG: YqjF family protein, partial [Ornithinibacter sp.]